jgi:predicted nicotinamide N-methyase
MAERPAPAHGAPASDGTGGYAWPAGLHLARDLAALVDCRGLVVCDLGCGGGALGCAALAHGAAAVHFCDADQGALARACAAAAALGAGARAHAHRHAWGAPLPVAACDAILGGDILYRPECHDALLATIASGLAPTGVALLADPRVRLEEDLARRAQAHGLSWRTERRSDFTLARLALEVAR